MKKPQARKIQSWLAAKGIRQRDIARECGVSDATVHKVIQNPDVITSRRVAAVVAIKIGKPIENVFPGYAKKEAA